MPRAFKVPLILSPKEMADRRSVILKWVFGGGEAFSGGVTFVELELMSVVVVVVTVVVRARATLNRNVSLI